MSKITVRGRPRAKKMDAEIVHPQIALTEYWPASGKELKGLTLTHIPTGYRITSFGTREACMRFLEDIKGANWDFDDPTAIPSATCGIVNAALERRVKGKRL